MCSVSVAVLEERHLGGESSRVGKRLGIAGLETAVCVEGGQIRRGKGSGTGLEWHNR